MALLISLLICLRVGKQDWDDTNICEVCASSYSRKLSPNHYGRGVVISVLPLPPIKAPLFKTTPSEYQPLQMSTNLFLKGASIKDCMSWYCFSAWCLFNEVSVIGFEKRKLDMWLKVCATC